MKQPPKDMGTSVRARLLNLARARGEDFQLVLTRYANERLLHRLARSRHGGRFVLKGATLFTLWTGEPHRVTRDVDLLGFGDPSEAHIRSVFAEVLAVDVDDDGVRFDASSLEVGAIRQGQAYRGVRVLVVARVTTARVRLQVDVGFGDAITPQPVPVDLPALLDFEAPRLLAYPRETVIAEKLEAMVQRGLANSRMKDFYDLAVLARTFAFEGEVLARAIGATFERRGTPLPTAPPVALTAEFAEDGTKGIQWRAFVRKSGVEGAGNLAEVVAEFGRFLPAGPRYQTRVTS